jgi:hypothetical protein
VGLIVANLLTNILVDDKSVWCYNMCIVNNKERQMTTAFQGLTTQEIRQVSMYGCTEQQLRESIEDSITFKLSGPLMIAAGMLSDAQEMICTEYGEVTDGRANEARQAINRAKWVMFTYAMENK